MGVVKLCCFYNVFSISCSCFEDAGLNGLIRDAIIA